MAGRPNRIVPGAPAASDPEQVPFPDSGASSPIDMTGCQILLHFNGDADDSSGNSRDGTVTGATNVFGFVGSGCYLFSGSTQYITAPDAGLPLTDSDRTMAFWVNWDGTTSRKMIVGYGSNGSAQSFSLRIGNYTTGGIEFIGWGAGDGTDRMTIVARKWTHIAVTYTNVGAASSMKMYKDGALQTTFAISPALNTTVQSGGTAPGLRIGWGYDSTNYYFPGMIDEFAIWSRVLSDAEISDIYDKQKWKEY